MLRTIPPRRWFRSVSTKRFSAPLVSPTSRFSLPPSIRLRSSCHHRAVPLFSSARDFSTTPTIRLATPTSDPPDPTTHKISTQRNISIIAHIDAGKTTLTERLLHYTNALSFSGAGAGSLPGDVDAGSTVTDFLEQERARGITIQSAAVGPVWWTGPASTESETATSSTSSGTPRAGHQSAITLVDTPGHVDFGIEVERAVRVVDGAVIVLDGVEGVEAQTEMVWRQASRYDVRSLILFVNKLDRPGASLARSVRSVLAHRLHERPVVLQLPLPNESSSYSDEAGIGGVIDIMRMEAIRFSGRAGEVVQHTPLSSSDALFAEASRARHALVETLAGLDDVLLDALLSAGEEADAHMALPADQIRAALRRQVLKGEVVPVLCGAAARNIGVQPVLDAIVDFLPSPADRATVFGMVREDGSTGGTPRRGNQDAGKGSDTPAKNEMEGELAVARDMEIYDGRRVPIKIGDEQAAALAFKVMWDRKRGPMTFVRVYSGTLSRTTALFNTTTQTRERLNKCLLAYADRFIEIPHLRAGQIGVLLGLRDTRTGDTLVDARAGSSRSALRLRQVHVPAPVFSMSIEPRSKSDEVPVSEALSMLVRTDPSLRLDEGSTDGGAGLGAAGTGQTVLSGMGELHLEIAKDRLANEFNVRARMGGVRVSFRETIQPGSSATVDELLDKEMAGKKVKAGCTISVRALEEDEVGDESLGGNTLVVELHEEADKAGNEARASAKKARKGNSDNPSGAELEGATLDSAAVRSALVSGLTASLSRGPLSSNPLTGLHVTLSSPLTFGPELSPPRALSAVASAALRKAVRQAGSGMMEPVMRVRIECEERNVGRVVGDLTSEQGGAVLGVEHEGLASSGASSGESSTLSTESEIYIPPETCDLQSLKSSTSASISTSALDEQDASLGRERTSVHARVPLARLVNYSSRLRALTGGAGTFDMRLDGFARVGKEREEEILKELGRA